MKFIDFEIFFDCPVHGLENQIFCFRSINEEFNDRWIKYEIIRERVKITQEEIDSEKKTIAGISDSYLGG